MIVNSGYLYLKYFSVNTKFETQVIVLNRSVTWICQIISKELSEIMCLKSKFSLKAKLILQ